MRISEEMLDRAVDAYIGEFNKQRWPHWKPDRAGRERLGKRLTKALEAALDGESEAKAEPLAREPERFDRRAAGDRWGR